LEVYCCILWLNANGVNGEDGILLYVATKKKVNPWRNGSLEIYTLLSIMYINGEMQVHVSICNQSCTLMEKCKCMYQFAKKKEEEEENKNDYRETWHVRGKVKQAVTPCEMAPFDLDSSDQLP